MSKLSNVLKFTGAFVGLVVVGLLIGWLGSSGHQPGTPLGNTTPPASRAQEDARNGLRSSAAPRISSIPSIDTQANETATPVPVPASDLITNWGDKLEQVLVSSGEETDKAKQLLEMFPHLPPDGQAEIERHL